MNTQIPDHLPRSKLQFGSTDPFLPGITLRIPNLYGTSDDFQRFLFSYLATDDAFRQFDLVKHFLDSSSDRFESFFALSLSTAASHELRHFHEFYGSPFGAKVLSNLILNAMSLPIAMQVVQSEDTIAVPISIWAQLSAQNYEIYRANTKSGELKKRPPEEAATAAVAAEGIINQIKRFYQPSEVSSRFGFSTRHVIEASAISQQKKVISDLFGDASLSFFENTLTQYDERKEYTKLGSIWRLVGPDALTSATIRNAIVFFALCGEWWDQSDSKYENPADRFLEIALLAHRTKRHPTVDNIMPFLEYCSKEMNVPTMDESLCGSVKWFGGFIASAKRNLKDMWRRLPTMKSMKRFLSCMDQLEASHRHMAGKIREDPLSFFDFARYLERAYDWLAAPRWYRSDTYFYSPSNPALNLQEKFGKGDWLVPGFVTVEEDENLYAPLLLSKFPTNGSSVLSYESAYQFGIDNYLGNVFWAKGFPDPEDEKYAFLFLQKRLSGKELIYLR